MKVQFFLNGGLTVKRRSRKRNKQQEEGATFPTGFQPNEQEGDE